MGGLSRNKGACLGLALAGMGLMSVAMFVHPMSPEDFLDQVASDPLQTVAALQGGGVAALFWIGAMVGAIGVSAGLIGILRRSAYLFSPHRLRAH